ncbi:translation machinery-associated protein 16 [Lycorma delicatula]|uniref:translation machinery-associated protein 16 n=1 Tax=Lycorma delicatula TaxID=130591 RepID=UPI003F50D498
MARKSTRKPELKVKQINHPNSRKAKQFAKQTNKSLKRNKSKILHQMKSNLLGEKLLFFRDNLDPKSTVCTPEDLSNLIEKYLGRFSEELEQIKLKHSIGQRNRQHASREDAIKLNISQELEEYTNCGIELPDLFSESQVKMLREWNGEIRFIQNFKLRRFRKDQLLKIEEINVSHSKNQDGNEKMLE